MSLENNEAPAVVKHCQPVVNIIRGELVAVQDKYKLEDTEKYQFGRSRIRGTFSTPIFADFADYIKSSATPVDAKPSDTETEVVDSVPVFVSRDNVKAVAVLNYNQAGFDQGHCDHIATLQLDPTVAWKKINELKGQKLNQKAFATTLEDWASVFRATTETGVLIPINEAIHAVRNMKIDSTAKSESSVSNVSESRSTLERIEAETTAGKLPAYFEIDDTAYIGLDVKFIKLRLIVNANDGNPVFQLQIVKEELLTNEIIQEFKEKVAELLPDQQVLIGTFQA
ncbi:MULTISPECIES: DUF2303 family protein [unclassified Acinetobacter]|uniref:DUF2303 family protein n=1 Tax=unclassified Acinetobacter TaxID=196816 RepID=UPI00244CDB4A|nr:MULTISPECIES: DUF2303 family protein [unclassified Acinetobacter]MDH0032529.1 YfdQ family protein [Acinetobacter sp. GD04021]MDH0885220.1 YfdQ family protein [Acinetobacter sp. GD03873]MDH1084452.1 YfdQ family protein [Acinetobacter sp. GD03983]MDH2188340.1 YfdQ family protein [Acinetobacter sp. GD03645]MDH2203851.1 YfdQ family protein [Acinetobacter sp. GD03647]